MKLRLLLASTLLLAACKSANKSETAVAPSAKPLPMTLEEAVKSSFRTPDNTKRDVYRHPLETLKFFGVKPEMTVVEIWPSGGWYTEILAPYLASKGKYVAAAPVVTSGPAFEGRKKLMAWMKANPEVGSKITDANFLPPEKLELVADGTADMVLTFRNVHNWMSKKGEQAAFDAFFKALKPGGILGVVEHRAKAKDKANPDSGYVHEKTVIDLAKKAGFKLASKSEINANPKDSTNHPNGVWTLPPVNKHEAADAAKYASIGESDRMTIKFIKPKR